MATKKVKENVNGNEEKALKDLLASIGNDFGTGSAILMSDPALKIERYSSGSLTFDSILGGGLPAGRIVEIYGPESSGKTTVALLAAAEIQRGGGKVAFIDAENAFNPDFAIKLGVDPTKLVISQPENGEQGLAIAEKFAESGLFKLIIVDSVSALVPKDEIEGDMGDAQMGKQARMMGQGLRKITSKLNKTKTTCIFINQLRMKIGIVFGNPETTSGGNALKFFASIRVETRKGDKITEGKEQIGHKIKITTKKNKTFAPFKTTEISLYYDKGFDKYEDIIDAGRLKGIIEQRGAYYSFNIDGKEEKKFQGKKALVDFFKSEEKDFEMLKVKIQETEDLIDEANDLSASDDI